ncbi:Beta-1,4-N-acetylgalactosaminyltransferase bre-4,Beta-1,4-galactosyltransferase 3 [Lepeophtheirus salmonis]|uniref:Beta-1,4-N-acetylgalactosaminyltransferase n=1 Tax=Lepeophtheirus salmonis TaxID=72036 RepID=A0A7R8CJL9_LEPSM|nr:Beta-1,4-N-acetylgalactosaminyltransferase bre-4,Beta-1,4-galactosyltransferase 3 [Lepeophtheirus salmonis]CAF2839890.1 Beta-1,4-N-acetylgalactosaminyltransferase bre-4,Beta-1,4-galactosyltransferase 3 [Lepeophtheirus salmonis]
MTSHGERELLARERELQQEGKYTISARSLQGSTLISGQLLPNFKAVADEKLLLAAHSANWEVVSSEQLLYVLTEDDGENLPMAWKKSLKILLYLAFVLVAFQYWSLLTLDRVTPGIKKASSSLFLIGWNFPGASQLFVSRNQTSSSLPSSTSFASSNLSLNVNPGRCPLIPPGLHGPIKVELKDVPSLQDMEGLYPQVGSGGRYKPPNCTSRHRVAIIVPYRDRKEHLTIFLYNIHHLLLKQQLDYAIFIVEQSGNGPFNRAMLFNVEDDRNLYSCPLHPRHMSVAINVFMYRLPYSDIFGGVSAMSVRHFKEVNGFSNSYWGWGAEDDDMFNRRYKMLKHAKDAPNPERFKMLFSGVKRIESDGFNTLKYKLLKIQYYKLYTWILADLSQVPTSG